MFFLNYIAVSKYCQVFFLIFFSNYFISTMYSIVFSFFILKHFYKSTQTFSLFRCFIECIIIYLVSVWMQFSQPSTRFLRLSSDIDGVKTRSICLLARICSTLDQ